MTDYRLIIFDLDGTLADTSPGIYNCHRYANEAMGRTPPTDEELSGVIGGPLLRTYTERFGFPTEQARRAVDIYRRHYAEVGVSDTVLYDGMAEALAELKRRGYLLAVATLKAEALAVPLLTKLGIAGLFDVIHGMDENDTRTKAGLIQMCMQELDCTEDSCVLVGDSIHDALGAAGANISFVGCTYGFGFACESDVAEYQPYAVISSARQLTDCFR